jgi:protein-S-isoprenylcysteine O-methyltransferase Ste14
MPEVALWAIWLAWFVSWCAAALSAERTVKQPARHRQILYRLLAGGGAMLLFGMYPVDVRADVILWVLALPFAWALVAMAAAGLLFTWWARIHLGRLWSASVSRKADHRVVDTGPYGIVRHPIYTGLIVASAATAAVRGALLAWLGVGLMTIGWVIKARMEEAFLREQLGAAAYDEYARRVPMLAPFGARKGR